mgnify:CR=1 FL=1
MGEQLRTAVEHLAVGIELTGVAFIVLGALLSIVLFARDLRRHHPDRAYVALRANLGRAILLGLEFLVAGDIVHTIIVEPTLHAAGALAIIVLIRTFLSFSLETEIEGRPPWRQAEDNGGSRL